MIKEKTISIISSRWSLFLLAGFILSCIFFYIKFASSAVHTLSSLEKAKKELLSLNVEVSEMESKRLAFENGINDELARNLGLVEVSDKIFIASKSNKTAFNFKN